MRYSEGSEYDYIHWCIYQEYQARQERETYPIEDEQMKAYVAGDRATANELWEKASQRRQELLEEFRRKEDIIYWLYLDTALRAEGKTFADVYEDGKSIVFRPG